MPSRQDQLHSYQYSLQRVVAALVTHDPDPSRSPLRRAGTTALVSLLIAAIAVGGAGLYGLLTGQSSVDATDTNVVFQEKGTGARFVYLDSDHKLHPVLNYSSGLLLSNGATPSLKSVSSDKLAAVPLGAPLGIPNAPDSLPAAGDLLTGRWSVCTDDSTGDPRSTLLVGDTLTDGVVAATAAKGALLVRDPDQNIFLVYGNRRFQVPRGRESATLSALNWNAQQPWNVAAAWINAVPAGPDLRGPQVPQSAGSSLAGNFRVGQLVTDGARQFAVMMPDGGAAAVTPMQASLMQADGVDGAQNIGRSAFIALRASGTHLSDANDPNGLPTDVPALATPTRACMTLPVDAKTGDGVRINPTVPAGVAVAGESAASGKAQADLVHVTRGRGAVVVGTPSASAPAGSGTVGLVTDTGRLYTLAGRDLLAKLGYDGVQPQQVPAQLLDLLPRGASLDPALARRTDPQG